MSKKKSLTHHRKTTGHISKGVLNYGNIALMGPHKGKLPRKTWGHRNRARALRHRDDEQRQVREAHVDFNIVQGYLNLGMTLHEAKDKAIVTQCLNYGTN